MSDTTYSLPVASRGTFEALLTKVNKKAAKLGVPPLVAEYLGEVQREIVSRLGRPTGRFTVDFRVRLTGETVKFNGWRLIGVVSPLTGDDGKLYPIITTVPGEHTVASHPDPLFCDHCKARRDRKETFIVAHDDGREAQVGRTCLGDFLGAVANSPDGVASLIGARSEFDSEVQNLSRGPRTFFANTLSNVLAATIACIRKHGWVPVSEARKTGKISTRVHALDMVEAIRNKPDPDDENYALAMNVWNDQYGSCLPLPTVSDFEEATQIREFLSVWLDKQEELGKMNDYLQTARTVLFVNAVNPAAVGITCSLVALARREQGKMAPAQVSSHVGTVGERLSMVVQFDGAFLTQNDMAVVSFKTETGDQLRWFTSPNQRPQMAVGEKTNIRCTVRRHDTYKGVAQTVINRPVFGVA
jgi:hypothetical protein